MSSRLMDILHPTKNSIFLIWGLTSDTLSPNPRGEGRLTQNGRYFVNGGRVLNVAAVAPTLKEARDKAYEGVSKISWRGMQYRHDIADKGLKRLKKRK